MSRLPAPIRTAPAPKTREELLDRLGRRWLVRKKTAAERVDPVLDEVLDLVLDLMEREGMAYDHGAGALFDTLLRWRGERQ
jgi:hypothetical protein